ncbi:MAG: MarC family protein [Flavobacteriales bacterium]|nr:MarC family protein [Flavobacteriales bacterium]
MLNLNFNLSEIATASMVLFAVIDIIGSVPIIIEIKRKAGEIHPAKATFVSLIIMVAFLFLGESILHIIGINVNSFAVAGAFVLFFMALEMILGVRLFREEETPKVASIVPLAFPLIAGAGTMTTILSLRSEFEAVNIIVAIVLNSLFVYVVLRMTDRIERLLGPGGLIVLRKVFGIICLALAVKLFSSNIQGLLHA